MFLFYFLCVFLAGCELFSPGAGANLTQLSTRSTDQHVAGGAIVFDIVAIFDKKLAAQFQKFNSKDYFQKIGNLTAIHPDKLAVWRMSQIPQSQNQIIQIVWKKKPCSPNLLMFFADYRNEQEHQIVIKPNTKQLNITFGPDKIEQLTQLRWTEGTATMKKNAKSIVQSMNFSFETKNVENKKEN